MLNLHPLPGDGRFYCGPAAIASFTGLHPKGEVREAINRIRGRKPTRGIIGMQVHELTAALNLLGLDAMAIYVNGKKPTLRQFLEANPNFCGVLNVTGHYIAVSGGMCQDNQSGYIYPIAKFKGIKKRVVCVISVKAKAAP